MTPRPDVVLATGDLTDHGTELSSDWPSAKESILARGPMPKGSSAVG